MNSIKIVSIKDLVEDKSKKNKSHNIKIISIRDLDDRERM